MSALLTAAVLLVQQSPAELSAFAAVKARALLRDELPCLGCHRLDGEGGRVGPDLSRLAGRGDFGVVYAMILDPQKTAPGTPMPKTPMPDATRRLIARYLVAARSGADTAAAGPSAPARLGPARDPAALYGNFCASCHGPRGRGDGDNARHLPVPPASHADREAMARRTDDRLFDAIAAGGAVLGRSPRMPAFGLTLTPGEIRSLVRYIRALCGCEGPAWSRDGASR